MLITTASRILDADPWTEAVVVVGEIGDTMEEDAAAYAASMTKPAIAFIAGRSAPPDRRMGNAGAIVTAGRGSGESRARALAEAGATEVALPTQIPDALRTAFPR